MQFLSDSYDALVKFVKSESSLSKAPGNFSHTLDLLSVKVDRIDKAIDEMLYYSYQYNLKIVGVSQISERESEQDTADTVVNCYFNTVSLLLVSLTIVVKISLFSSLVHFST